MYDLVDTVPTEQIEPGTNVLIAGPSMAGKRTLAFDILRAGASRGEGSIVITTKDSAENVVEEFDPEATLGVVDCVSKQRGDELIDDPRVKYASSPVDMTGIGIKLSETLEEFHNGRGVTHNRVLLHSVSTLLMYSDLQTVFRFLHVFTGRIQSADALGLYVIDSTAHDEQTMNTLKQLFDGVVRLEQGDEPTVQVTGL